MNHTIIAPNYSQMQRSKSSTKKTTSKLNEYNSWIMLRPCSHIYFLFFGEDSTPKIHQGEISIHSFFVSITVTFAGAQWWCAVFWFPCVGRNSLLQLTDKQWCVWNNVQGCRWRVSQRIIVRDTTQGHCRSLHLPNINMNVCIHAGHHMRAGLSLNLNLNNGWTVIYQPLHI